ncbi:unnamed protein product [Durusdinium trenchii]|uniref:Uncharacterized protein n=2 Tax=Durusdinium trenchii TaxID=1381693 RepID=A0ABP0HDX4_9DINO
MNSLRPWNLFGKTMYAAHAQGAGSNLVLQLSKARAKQQAQETDLSSPFLRNFFYLLAPSSVFWAWLLFTRWRYGDADRLRALEDKPGGVILLDLLAWRITAHLGPYQVPNFCHAKMHEESLKMLQESVMLDQERMRALSRLGQLSQRHLAAQSLAPLGAEAGPGAPLEAIRPLLFDAFYQASESARAPGSSTESHKAQATKIILDVVSACAPEERQVPPWVLSGLVRARGAPWQSGAQGEEVRATVLVQLLRTPANAQTAASLPEVCEYLARPGLKRKEDTAWPLKAYLMSGETHDILRRGARLVAKQRPGAVEPQLKRDRDTPNLQIKRDVRNAWSTILLTAGWAAMQHFSGVYTIQATLQMAAGVAGALGGTVVLETLWRLEELAIESEWYWKDPFGTVPASAVMVLANCGALAWAVRHSCIVPFLICRLFKDDYFDAHRTFE